ncbi:plasmid stabilization protein [Candidatus Poribacteria bacterium]|nr:MAG: plasmid stabilization protein [Candidatus Poribacteria bacterium]
MRKMDLQQQAIMLIEQLSTEELKEVVDYLTDLQGKDADNILSTSHAQEIPEKGLGTFIHKLFKEIGGVELEIPPREPMREPPRFDK